MQDFQRLRQFGADIPGIRHVKLVWIQHRVQYPEYKKRKPLSGPPSDMLSFRLELGASCYESLAGLVVLVLVEVLDEASCEILCLLVPYCGI